MKATELEAVLDENVAAIIEHLDLDAVRRPRRDAQRVNVDFPASLARPSSRHGSLNVSAAKPVNDPCWASPLDGPPDPADMRSAGQAANRC
jgi:hypothetical protein